MGHAASALRTARGLLVLCAAAWACMVHAAWVADASQGALSQTPLASEPRAGVLDRALQMDAQAQQRNLDLLLDAREAPDGAALLQRGAHGAQARSPVLPQDIEAVQAPGAPPLPRMLGLRATEEDRSRATTARKEWRAAGQGDSAYGAGPGGGAIAERPGADGAGNQNRGRSSEELEGVRQALRDAREFVLEHRFSLLGGVVMFGLLFAALRGFMRRR